MQILMKEITQINTENSTDLGTGWWNPDLEPDDFRRLGYQAVDMMADYFDSIRDLPVFPGKSSQEVASIFNEPVVCKNPIQTI